MPQASCPMPGVGLTRCSFRLDWRGLGGPPLFVFLLFRFPAERSGSADHLVIGAELHRLRAGDGDEGFLAADRRAVGLAALVLAVRSETPALDVVGEGDG